MPIRCLLRWLLERDVFVRVIIVLADRAELTAAFGVFFSYGIYIGDLIMRRILISTLVLAGFAGSAVAAEYYVVRGPDKKCKVVETRPTDTKIVVMGDKAFISRDEAEKQVKVICKEM